MSEIERFKEEILKNYPRLTPDSPFRFECHHGLACFNACCGDVNIFLTPYDIIRLKQALGISSSEFLAKFTLAPFDKKLRYPIRLLKMNDDQKKTCPFVSEQGCTVYGDRPWACRMFPLGLASPSEEDKSVEDEFYFLLQESICQGFGGKREWTVGDWLKDQGITEYTKVGDLFKEITLHPFFREGKELKPQAMEMFHMVCYDIDKFRGFVFESSFLEKFEVAEDVRQAIKEDDVELLKFGFLWLRFALFGERTMILKEGVEQTVKRKMQDKVDQAKATGK